MPRNVAIGLGLMEFPFDSVAGYWRWVDLCEAGGVDSLWQTDRMVSREPILECMSVMAALAGRTRRIKFGVNVLSLAFRDPVLLAKQCATIDVLSEGRLLPAFGIGSPLAPGMADPQPRHQDPRPQDRRRARDHPPAVGRGRGRFRGRALPAVAAPRSAQSRCSPICRCGSAARPRRRSGAPRGSAPAGRPAARRPRTWRRRRRDPRRRDRRRPADRRRPLRRRHRRSALAGPTTRRSNGCSTPTAGAPAATRSAISRSATPRRSSRASPPMSRPAISKFILRPAARGDDEMLAQTRRLVDEVLPLVAARWPRPRRAAAAAAE